MLLASTIICAAPVEVLVFRTLPTVLAIGFSRANSHDEGEAGGQVGSTIEENSGRSCSSCNKAFPYLLSHAKFLPLPPPQSSYRSPLPLFRFKTLEALNSLSYHDHAMVALLQVC
mmetsp:Transcript_14922/g.34368  ORF Transcript_14922/g.34368 Transcript_14922/m.34368 type:complete len:115 (-) Transcript_14922:40-384(-)